MKIKFINKKAIKSLAKFILVGTLAVATPIGISSCNNKEQIVDDFKTIDVTISKDDHLGQINDKDNSNGSYEFSLVDITDYAKQNNYEIEELSDDTKDKGIIIDVSVDSDAKLYQRIDYIKEIVSRYKITYPICLDINSLFTPDYEDQCFWSFENNIVKKFTQKLTENGCYVCVMGDPSKLDLLTDYKYNEIAVVSNWDYVDRNKYNMIVLNGVVNTLGTDFAKMIREEGYNLPSKFVDDYVYSIKEGDTLYRLQVNYGLGVESICEYNNINETDILNIDQKIVLPNVYGNIINYYYNKENKTLIDTEQVKKDYYIGIDVSFYQGKIDWNTVAQKVQFAIIRSGYAAKLDYNFDEYMQSCSEIGLPHGVYHFSKARDLEELKEELAVLLPALEKYQDVSLPVYIDFETESYDKEDNRVNMLINGTNEEKQLMNDIIRTFCATLEKAGYAAGIYVNKDAIPYLDNDIRSKYAVWASGGEFYNRSMDYDNIKLGYQLDKYTTAFQVSQYGEASDFGIYDTHYVDIDVMNKSFLDNLLKRINQDKVKTLR